VPSDGEFGKRGWTQYVGERLGGLALVAGTSGEPPTSAWAQFPDYERFREFYRVYDRIERTNFWVGAKESPPAGGAPRWECVGPVTYQGHAAIQRDIANVRAALDGTPVEEAFMPVAAPCSVEANRVNRYYPTEEAFLFAVADALRVEYQAIVDAGLLLQVDDAWLPMRYSRMGANPSLTDYYRWADVRVAALNHALQGIPSDRVRYHICWGSQNVPHMADISLRDMLPLLFNVRAGAYAIEAANPRHAHEWQVWETAKLPKNNMIIPENNGMFWFRQILPRTSC
jgi:5-methyltetrahydropteroyltriglutamate--homocysteine methyltransferase